MRKVVAVICSTVFVLCLAALPVIDYIGGRLCRPSDVPPFLPAKVVPFGVGFFAVAILVTSAITSLRVRRDRAWTIGALAIVVVATSVFLLSAPHLPGFLHGLRDRFVTQVGYPKMREFARELSQPGAPVDSEGILRKPGRGSTPTSKERQRQWNDLLARYPFLEWRFGANTVIVRGGLVELTWGGPLTGHWGFQVAPNGTVGAIDEDEGRVLKVADDIQFVYYDD